MKKIVGRHICTCFTVLILMLGMLALLSGCSITQKKKDKVSDIEFTIVNEQDIPTELKKLIEEKKQNTMRLTYTTKDATYVVAGYGTQPTSGYSITVNDVYLGTNAVYVDTSLVGPRQDEGVTELPTTPYIVLKLEKREEAVVFEI